MSDYFNEVRNVLTRGIDELGIQVELSSKQIDLMASYAELVVERNQVVNLTSITNAKEFAVKHLLDSLSVFRLPLEETVTGVDIGTGAGFPGIPLAIALPVSRFMLVDSLRKRISFLEEASTELEIPNVQFCHGRAEDLGHMEPHREVYEMAFARAVAQLRVLVEYCSPFIKVGGFFVAMKSGDVQEEIRESARAIQSVGLELQRVDAFSLPEEMGMRSLLLFRKVSKTPLKYPRKAGTPGKSPL